MSFEQNKALIQEFVDGFNQGDLSVIDRLVARDFFTYRPAAGEPTAPQVTRDLVADLRPALPDLRLRAGNFADGGDQLTFELTMTGTHAGDLWGSPPQGGHLDWTSTVACRFEDGRFAFSWPDVAVPELLSVLRPLGLVPPPDQMDIPPEYPVVVPEFLLKVVMTGRVEEPLCEHLDLIQISGPAANTGTLVCEQCVAQGDVWPALRFCLICGFIGCCDTSKNKHMKQHYEDTGHAIFRSVRLHEEWGWCYEHNTFYTGRTLARYG